LQLLYLSAEFVFIDDITIYILTLLADTREVLGAFRSQACGLCEICQNNTTNVMKLGTQNISPIQQQLFQPNPPSVPFTYCPSARRQGIPA